MQPSVLVWQWVPVVSDHLRDLIGLGRLQIWVVDTYYYHTLLPYLVTEKLLRRVGFGLCAPYIISLWGVIRVGSRWRSNDVPSATSRSLWV